MEGQRRHVAISWLLDLLFPRFCLRCGKEGGIWCKDCDEVFVPGGGDTSCPFCEKYDQNRVCDECCNTVFLDGVSALSTYADPIVQKAVGLWKYHGDRDVEGLVERWVRQRFTGSMFKDFDAVTAAPLHPTKRRARGFDQAERFARMIGEVAGVPYRNLLVRSRKTQAQAQLPQEKRQVGVLDEVFDCVANPPKRVLVCDDVFTSGATLDAAAKALVEAGAGRVWGCVVARG